MRLERQRGSQNVLACHATQLGTGPLADIRRHWSACGCAAMVIASADGHCAALYCLHDAILLNICGANQRSGEPEGREATWAKTSDVWPPLTTHLPSMTTKGTPETPLRRASAMSASTSAWHSSDSRKSRACRSGVSGIGQLVV